MDLLKTHTSGQMRLMALASVVNYANFKDKMDSDTSKTPSNDTPKKKKSFKQMTSAEIERYYQESGVF